MKLLRSFPVLAFALVLLSVTALCIVQRSVGLLLVAGTLAAISWYITEGPRGRSLPRWVSNILVVAVTLSVVADVVQNRSELLSALGRFAVWLTVIKLYERRTVRDHAQLLTLSVLLMLTACLQSNDLIFGLLLLMYAALGVYVLLLFQVYSAFEREQLARQAVLPADYRLVPPLKPVTGPHVGWSFRAQGMGLALAGITISIIVFLGFPRGYGAGMLGAMRLPPASRTTQFSPTIDLNVGGRINESRDKVLTIQLRDERDQPIRHDAPLLLRGATLNYYKGNGQWTILGPRVSSERRFNRSREWNALTTASLDGQRTITQQIILNRPVNHVQPLFTIEAPVAVQGDSSGTIVYNPATQILTSDADTRRMVMYTVKAVTAPNDAMLAELASTVQPSTRVNWFSRDGRQVLIDVADARLIAAGITATPPQEAADRWKWNMEAAAALTRYLQSTDFTYTTDLSSVVSSGPGVDPIVRFLTESRRGHCEFFASGLAALCNAKGIPVRVVVGYVAYQYDDAQQQYNVLASNAHAWTEVAVGPNRWQMFDPTPPVTLLAIHASDKTLADEVRWVYQRFEGDWSSTIVDFNSTAQSQLAATINRGWASRVSAIIDSIRGWMNRVNRAFSLGPAGYIWMGIVGLAIVIAIIALVKLMRRSLTIRRTLHLYHVHGKEYQRMLRQLGFYMDMLRVLKRAGFPKPAWLPPLQHAATLQRTNREAAELAREITDVFYDARYGRLALDRQSLLSANRLVQRLEATLRHGASGD